MTGYSFHGNMSCRLDLVRNKVMIESFDHTVACVELRNKLFLCLRLGMQRALMACIHIKCLLLMASWSELNLMLDKSCDSFDRNHVGIRLFQCRAFDA